ncbi:MAG: hypothetical protein MMC23_000910 [Stictis urceolatum]|nr:hypothetical protein [Stictis urceolata]
MRGLSKFVNTSPLLNDVFRSTWPGPWDTFAGVHEQKLLQAAPNLQRGQSDARAEAAAIRDTWTFSAPTFSFLPLAGRLPADEMVPCRLPELLWPRRLLLRLIILMATFDEELRNVVSSKVLKRKVWLAHWTVKDLEDLDRWMRLYEYPEESRADKEYD